MIIPIIAPISIPNVPFYSQFQDISSLAWEKKGCGVTSLAMIINYYTPNAVSVDTLLTKAISAGAYDPNAGWKHKGLVALAGTYGLQGNSYELSGLTTAKAFAQFQTFANDGPVIASVHYKFDPKNPIPHMVVVDGIKDGTVYYNDPAAKNGEKQISVEDFQKAWKKKFIVVRPTQNTPLAVTPKYILSALPI